MTDNHHGMAEDHNFDPGFDFELRDYDESFAYWRFINHPEEWKVPTTEAENESP